MYAPLFYISLILILITVAYRDIPGTPRPIPSINPFTTGNPFMGTKLLGFSTGRGSGALKGLSLSRKLARKSWGVGSGACNINSILLSRGARLIVCDKVHNTPPGMKQHPAWDDEILSRFPPKPAQHTNNNDGGFGGRMSSRFFHGRVARRVGSTGRREIGIRKSSEGVCYTRPRTVYISLEVRSTFFCFDSRGS